MNSDQLMLVGSQIVGAVFIAAAVMKIANPNNFLSHVAKLGLVPRRLVRRAVPVLIGLEGAWGAALLLAFASSIVLPVTVVGLIVLSSMSMWGVKSGKTEDCGCYGGFITPSLWQSVGLNAVYLALVAAAWWSHPSSSSAPWKFAAIVVVAVALAAFTEYSIRRSTPAESPLKVGRAWQSAWAGSAALDDGDNLVSYLGTHCPYCKRWIPVLNAIHSVDSLPPVTAIFAGPPDSIRQFVDETGAQIPVATMEPAVINTLAPAVPTTVLIEAGRIKEVWVGVMTPEFRDRFKRAFFPTGASLQAH